jgi:hypothetical protein
MMEILTVINYFIWLNKIPIETFKVRGQVFDL